MRTARPLFLALALLCGAACGGDCGEIQDEARRLKAAYQACQGGQACVVRNLYELVPNSCLGAFQCSDALRADADLDRLARLGRQLSEDVQSCGMCVQASCAPAPAEARCNLATGRCEVVPGS